MRTPLAIRRFLWVALPSLALCAPALGAPDLIGGTTCPDVLASGFEDRDADPEAFPGPAGLCHPLQVWGPPGTPPPPEATILPVGEFLALARPGSFDIITRAGLDAGIAAGDTDAVMARATIDGLAAADPSLLGLKPTEPLPQAGIQRLPDGNYLMDLGTGVNAQRVMLHGVDIRYEETADGLTDTLARANQEAHYRSLHDLLPVDQRAGLPDPADVTAFAALSDAAMAAHARELVRRIEQYVPHENVQESTAPGVARKIGIFSPLTGCSNHHPLNLFLQYDWPLKAYTTRIRNQRSRGTCVAFATIGGIESLIRRQTGVNTNYSEQELYAVAKGVWFPTANSYGDGLSSGNLVAELKDRNFRIDADQRWPYNGSALRVDDEDDRTYSMSCTGYDNPYCSDTNHQMKVACTAVGNQHVCIATRPPGVTGAGHDPARLTSTVSLWNSFEPENSLASIRAHLNALHPVVFTFDADDWFSAAANSGLILDITDQPNPDENAGVVSIADGGAGEVGGHAVLIVGYLPNGQIPDASGAPNGAGGGYLIVKNSWGCAGDGGYVYLNYDWAADQARAAYAIVGATTTAAAPSATLSVSDSLVTESGTVQIRAAVNSHTTRVRIYRGLENDDPVFEATVDGGEATTLTYNASFSGNALNGIQLYFARANDQFGNETVSGLVGINVRIDAEAPEVTLAAVPTALAAPGSITLTASASDDVGVTRVRFYRGFQFLGQDTTAPYQLTRSVPVSEAGSSPYLAIAYDAVGNTEMSNIVDVFASAPLRPVVTQFTATPSTMPAGGGNVTLSWSTGLAQSVAISPGVGSVATSGSVVVPVTQSTSFVLAATNAAGTTGATASVLILPAPLIVSFTATPSSLPAGGGTVDLRWGVLGATSLSIDQGVGTVTGLSHMPVNVAQTTTFTLTATSASGTSTRPVTATVAAGGDTQPPTVVLVASNDFVTEPETITLTATASDNVSVARVEFMRAGGLLGADTTVPYTWPVALTAADNGALAFTARAYDAAENFATSPPVNVIVDIEAPAGDDTYVSPAGSNAGNDCSAVATPCATLAYAGARTGPGKTIFLLDGTYSPANQGVDEYGVPDGVSVAGLNAPIPYPPVLMRLRLRISNADVTSIAFDRTAGDPAGLEVLGGTVALVDIAYRGKFVAPDPPGLEVTGSSLATLSTVDVPDLAAMTESHAQASVALVHVRDNAQLTMTGIRVGGPGVGASLLAGDPGPGAIEVLELGTLRIENGDIAARNRVITLRGSPTLEIADTTIQASAVTDNAFAILATGPGTTATINVDGTTIQGFHSSIAGTTAAAIGVWDGSATPGAMVADIDLTRTELQLSSYGILVAPTADAEISGVDSSISMNRFGGIRGDGAVELDLSGGEVSENGFEPAGAMPTPRHGGIWLGSDKPCEVRLRGVAVIDNNASGFATGNHGVTLRCDDSSTFDLGTEGQPGNNTFTQGDLPAATSNLFVEVDPGVVVTAVGNTFNADEQGADQGGRYHVGVPPCPVAVYCDLTSGAGVNYRIESGTLRLDADN
jgi:hypothetical protein